jgi:hypothetical protein
MVRGVSLSGARVPCAECSTLFAPSIVTGGRRPRSSLSLRQACPSCKKIKKAEKKQRKQNR